MIQDDLLLKLGKELVESPFLSVMIVNKRYEVVWHNQRFADELCGGKPMQGSPCFQAAGAEKVHADCPLQRSIRTGERIKGFLDFGEKNFLFLSIPLDEEHAAKVHIMLPKEADGEQVSG